MARHPESICYGRSTQSPSPQRTLTLFSRHSVLHPGARLALAATAALSAGMVLGGGAALADLVDGYFPPGIIGPDAKTGITVNSRERPATDPQGVHVGNFTIRPQVSFGAGYDSNPLFSAHAKPAALAQTTGSISAASNGVGDTLSGLITFDDTRYPSLANQSATNWSASIGKLFTLAADRLALTATHLGLHQTARDLNSAALDTPGAYGVNNLRATYTAERGQFTFTPQLQYTGYRYEDVLISGARVSQAYRDRDIVDGELGTKFSSALLHDIALVLRGASIQYRVAQPGQMKPDATTAAALVGIDHATSAVWRYRFLAGAQSRQSSSPAVKARTAPVAEANLIYQPSGLTTVGLTVTRAVQDAAGEFAAAFTYTEARLSVDHELTRDILLHAHLRMQRAEYEQTSATETVSNAEASATWLMNRNMRLIGSYSYVSKQPTAGGAITESIAMVRLQLGL